MGKMTINDSGRNLAGAAGIARACGKPGGEENLPRRAFREVASVEAAKLPERCHLDRTRAVCHF